MKSFARSIFASVSILAMLAVVVTIAPAASAQDTLDSVKAAIVTKWDALKSVSGKFSGNASIKLNPQMPSPLQLVAGGVTDYAKEGQTPKYRIKAWAGMSETAPLASIYSVCDGKEVHVDSLVPFGQRNSEVVPLEQAFNFGGQRFFDEIGKGLNLALAPAEKVGDKDCYVIEGVAKEPNPDFPLSKLKMFFAKDIGVIMKVAFLDAANAEIGALTMTEVKVDQPIAEDVFKYVPAVPPTPPAPAPAPAAK